MNKKNKEIMIKSSLKRFPINFIRTSKNIISMAKLKQNTALPFKVQIESTAICNLKCKMCPQNNMKRKKGHLKFEIFKKIYNEIKPPYLNLTGFGEPLLNPDIFKIIKYAKKNGSYVKLDTNGTLLNQENICKLLDTKIDIISNSIDGMNKETYEKIRVGANFEKVISNLKNLVKIRNKINSKTEIHIFLVLQKDNFKEFPDFIKFGDSIGVDSISGTFVSEESYKQNKKINIEKINKKELDNLIKELKKIQKGIKANLEIDELIEFIENWEKKKTKYWSKIPCYLPWYSPFITWDGIVTPCCFCVDKEIILGDATKENFKKIWNGTKMKEFRKMVSTNRIGLCTTCDVDETYIKEQFKKFYLN